MKEEMKALEKNSTWQIVDRPKDKRVVDYRWIYTMKCKSDGTLDRYKARLTPTLAGTNVFLRGDLEKEVYMEIPQDSILIIKRTRYAYSKRHCMNLNSLPEHVLEDFLKS
ncbi:hypothetical protein CR513_46377, partial [Mucuna pruriens]